MKYQVHKFWDTLFPPKDIFTDALVKLNAEGFYCDGTADPIDMDAFLKSDTPMSRMFKMLFKAMVEKPVDTKGICFTTGENPEFKGYIK
jgi:hypothetical protein